MSTRLINLVVLAVFTGVAAGCASGGTSGADAGGFLQGFADGFLILVEFVRGDLVAAGHLSSIQTQTSYGVGYLVGALSFAGLGTAFSVP